MGLNWLTAVKLIPWADVAAATPGILKGAKNLWSRTRKNGARSGGASGDATDGAGTDVDSLAPGDPAVVAARLVRLATRVDELETGQRSASDLINALAEQNAQLVAAVAALRTRMRALTGLLALVALALIALWLR